MSTNLTPASTPAHPIRRSRLLTMAAVVILAACQTVPVNPGDATDPIVTFKVRGTDGQYHPQSSVQYQGQPIQAIAIVEDPQGVKAISVQYVNPNASSCYAGGTLYSGNYYLGTASPKHQSLTGSSGNVPTQVSIVPSIQGPFTCTALGVQGYPNGHVLHLRATGTNWSSNAANATATAELEIKL